MTTQLDEDDLVVDFTDRPSIARAFRRDGRRLVHEISTPSQTFESWMDDVHDTGDALGDWWKAYLRGGRVGADSQLATPLRTAELFCGSGGLALGVGQACSELGIGRRSVMAADQDGEAVAIYRRRNETRATSTASVSALVDYRVEGTGEEAEFLYDPEVVDAAWEDLVGNVDAVLAGPPCQGHSHLNNRTRFSDRRNQLYLTVPAMALALRAPIVVVENVRAVIHDRRQVVQSTETLLRSAGYTVTCGVVKAVELGWPQRRERFFLVARRDRDPIPLEQVASAFADVPRDIKWAIGELAGLPADDFMSLQPEFSEENRRRIDWLHDNEAYDLPPSERPDCHKEGTTYNAVYGRLHPDRPAPTITTGFLTPGRGRYIHPTERRVLTPREAARLQGFPDDYDFRPDPPAIPSKAKLTKWIGDAVPMSLGYVAGISALGNGWA